jgi:hypothetical protein
MAKKILTFERLLEFFNELKIYIYNEVTTSANSVMSKVQTQLNTKVAKTVEYYGDINSLVTSGFYRVGTNTNLPAGYEYGQIIVSRGSDTATQICCSYSTGKIITRSCNSPDSNPKWTKWNEYATQEDLDNISSDGGFEFEYEEGSEAIIVLDGSGGKSGWYYLTEKSGQTGTITLPTGFKELHIVIGIANYMYTFNILADYLSSADMMFRNGYCLSTSVYGDVYISVNKTSISGWTVRKENVVQNASVKVYYK